MSDHSGRLDERRRKEAASLLTVQRRVAAIGFFAVAVHGVFGLIGAAHVIDAEGRHGTAVGLTVMSGVVAVIVYLVLRIILGKKLWSPGWIVVAIAPTVVAFFWIL